MRCTHEHMSLKDCYRTGVYSETAYWAAKLLYPEAEAVSFSFMVDDSKQDVKFTTKFRDWKVLNETQIPNSRFGAALYPSTDLDGEVVLKFKDWNQLRINTTNPAEVRRRVKEDFLSLSHWLVDTMKSRKRLGDLAKRIILFFKGDKELRKLPLRFAIVSEVLGKEHVEEFTMTVDELRCVACVIGDCASAYSQDLVSKAKGVPNNPMEQMRDTMVSMKYNELLGMLKEHAQPVEDLRREMMDLFRKQCPGMEEWKVFRELERSRVWFLLFPLK